jgi:hypothetical protein
MSGETPTFEAAARVPQLTLPALRPGRAEEGLVDLSRALARWSTELYAVLVALARNRVAVGASSERPAATGCGLLWLDTDTRQLSVDLGTWELVA